MHKHAYGLLGFLAILVWIALFSTGLLIDTKDYREQLKNGHISLPLLALTTFLYLPTNVAFLSIVSGLLGGCASILSDPSHISGELAQARACGAAPRADRLERRAAYLQESPVLSMIRGFLVYLAVVSGILLIIADPFKETTAEQFIRIAGMISALSFVMGYDPTRFEDLIDKFTSAGQNGSGEGRNISQRTIDAVALKAVEGRSADKPG